MKILLIQPGEAPRPVTISGTLESMQQLVGGSIEAVYPFQEPVALVCNDEGKVNNLTPNRVLRHPETGKIYDIMFGTFFLCYAPADSENFESLSQEQIERYTEYFECNGKLSLFSIVMESL